ncbi:phosphoribosyltransferase family protein [Streptomyces sp. NPDC056485]|uniref:phosphoribosyltransferase family protein n=1 Tax=Streptomyces sp. NPDC056485 TaxID=3345834 RepID=UPI0036C4DD8F
MADAGVTCLTCRTPTRVGSLGTPYERCFRCASTVSHYLDGFVPICYSLHDAFEGVLWRAKNDDSASWLRIPLGALLWSFLNAHESCIEGAYGGPFDARIIMPSHSSTRGGASHLGKVVDHIQDFSQCWDDSILVKNDASKAEARRGSVVKDLFTASSKVSGKRILILDDTFTTGGTLASAAQALKIAGARTVVGIGFGRQLSADWIDSKDLVAKLAERVLSLDECVVHGMRSSDPFAALFDHRRK